ncbi:MAG: NUC127 domain-containing protein [Olpidium bornovanus]|uniref:NUC127 domain-containing protein n=1 Tax=Olpidium bornovanus TaxID=278681 RepID=A0A8H8DF41_9FUNG|nr:MAG: NUC127 domain-containing protein [Olpidium bornovanus]
MLVLFETPAGYALFKMAHGGKLLENADDVYKEFDTAERATKALKLRAFGKFENTTEALSAVTALVEGKLGKDLKKFLSKELSEKEIKKEQLMVADSKLGV